MSQSPFKVSALLCVAMISCQIFGADEIEATEASNFIVAPPPLEKIEASKPAKPVQAQPEVPAQLFKTPPLAAPQPEMIQPIEEAKIKTEPPPLPKPVEETPKPLTPAQLGIIKALKKPIYIELPQELATLKRNSFPGSSMSSPSGFGMDWGSLAIGLSYQGQSRIAPEPDSGLSIAMGIGNAQKQLGMEVAATFTRLTHGFVGNGLLSLKIHHTFPNEVGVGFALENFFSWGQTDAAKTVYFVGTKYFRLRENLTDYFSLLTVSGGLGNGRFLRESDYLAGVSKLNFFVCGSLLVSRPLSIILDWKGSDLSAGLSIAPFRYVHFSVSVGFDDITRTSGVGSRYVATAGLGITFQSDTYL